MHHWIINVMFFSSEDALEDSIQSSDKTYISPYDVLFQLLPTHAAPVIELVQIGNKLAFTSGR